MSAQLLHRRRHLAQLLVAVALVVGVLGPARGTVTGQALFLWGALVMIFLSRHGGKRPGKFWAVLRARLTFRWKKPVMGGARPIQS